jgi:hypothetical protein
MKAVEIIKHCAGLTRGQVFVDLLGRLAALRLAEHLFAVYPDAVDTSRVWFNAWLTHELTKFTTDLICKERP